MYGHRAGQLEVLLVHPGGPLWRKKDEGAWSIPKGEPEEGEDLLTAAMRELHEEIGIEPQGNLLDLGWIKQKGGKTVYAWAFEGNLPDGFQVCSNNFEMEWPPRSRKMQSFPEVDQACFFPLEEARRKLKEAQTPFLDRLVEALGSARIPRA